MAGADAWIHIYPLSARLRQLLQLWKDEFSQIYFTYYSWLYNLDIKFCINRIFHRQQANAETLVKLYRYWLYTGSYDTSNNLVSKRIKKNAETKQTERAGIKRIPEINNGGRFNLFNSIKANKANL